MEVKERVHLLEDSDGDGRADRAQVFYEGFNEEINGVIAGVMKNGRDVLVTIYPDLWRLRDTDGDGVADEIESLFRGFGVHAAFDGHDLHGLTWGPDGKIYFSVGDNGFSVVNKEGRKLHHPNTGGVLRMNPDYTELEVFAYGLRNVQEIAFDPYGNLFAVDNDGDLEDERERFVYITEGSDSGWRLNWQFRTKGWARFTDQPDYNPWISGDMWKPHFNGQPAHITPPLSNYSVGPGGFKFNPGTALNDQYKNYFFCVQFPVKKITAFKVKPKGAFFEMSGAHVFHFGMMASAVNFGPGGGMFITDWDGLWSPNERGAIYIKDDPSVAGSAIREEVKRILNEGPHSRSTEELVELLAHEDQRVRQLAQFELSKRKEGEQLLEVAMDTSAEPLARIHALWGVAQSNGSGLDELEKKIPFHDHDPEIRAQSAKISGDLHLRAAAAPLIKLLEDKQPRVRFFAAMSLGKCGDGTAISPLVALLESNNDEDAYIRHACVMGLAGIGNVEVLSSLASHSSEAVRLGAVLSLRRLKSSAVTLFLSDENLFVQREVASAIHDDFSIPEALPALAGRLHSSDLPNDEAIIRRAISANLRLGREENAARLIQYVMDPSRSESMRIEALESLADWNNDPFVDRVEGRVRELPTRNPVLADELIALRLPEILESTEELLSRVATRIAREHNIIVGNEVFAEWVASPARSVAVRTEALHLLAKRKADNLDSMVMKALESDHSQLRVAGWQIMVSQDPETFITRIRQEFWNLSLKEQQGILRIISQVDLPEANRLLGQSLDRLIDNNLPKELHLDVLEAAKTTSAPILESKLKIYEATLKTNDTMAHYRPVLFGGDPEIGKQIYTHHVMAQCIRCHNAGGEDKQVGPPLDGIGSRVNREDLLQSLIEPSAVIAQGYESISLDLENGDTIDGRIGSETKHIITIRTVMGELKTIRKSDVIDRSVDSVSSMPPMGLLLKPTELRDLLEYLASWK